MSIQFSARGGAAPLAAGEGPALAPALLGFLPRNRCESLLGDLQERSNIIAATAGEHKASVWYWRELLRSIPPLAWALLKKAALGPYRQIW